MPFPFCAALLARWLESYYLHWAQLPQSSPILAFALDLTRPKSELLFENALLRQQFAIPQRQGHETRLLRRGHLRPLL